MKPRTAAVVTLALLVVALAGLVVGVVATIAGPYLLAPPALGVGLVCAVSGYFAADRWVP